MSPNVSRCAERFKAVLSKPVFEEIARETKYCRKIRKFTPHRALWTLTAALASKVNTLTGIHRLFKELTNEKIGYKPLYLRLAQPGFPEFFKECLSHLMTNLTEPIANCKLKAVKEFEDIVIQDGSTLTVHPSLADVFPCRFTNKSPAALKVHCTYSLYEGQAQAIAISPDTQSERDFLPEPEQMRNKLLLIDAGYFGYKYFAAVEASGGHYICPAPKSRNNPKILKCYSGFRKGQTEGKRINEIDLPKRNVDFLVQGRSQDGTRYTFRVVCKYVPDKDCHVRLATSLPRARFSVDVVGSLYRLRWQVELFFKEAKSFTNLKKFQTKDVHIVEGLVWASLLTVLLRRFLLYSAFKKTKQRWAPFIAGSVGWRFFPELARACINQFRKLKRILTRTFDTLLELAPRTNSQRIDVFDVLRIEPL